METSALNVLAAVIRRSGQAAERARSLAKDCGFAAVPVQSEQVLAEL